ncbi:MAG: polyphosphate polymerase domain-containing protein [Clostridia bacterium]|nr:polyphosphate polymerase domain-containing protein [Clostridia bacterium]
MSKDIYIFKRIEKKYRIGLTDKENLLSEISDKLIPDSHGKGRIFSLYLDTPDYRLIRASIEAKTYKEKLRLRCYGTPSDDSKVFFEIKKKFKGVVYKRRVAMMLSEANDYIYNGILPEDSQIMREIDYAMHFYNRPAPSTLITYDREAYYLKDAPYVRITFDSNIKYQSGGLFYENGSGRQILPDDECILEIKTDGAMPLWLSHALDKCEILPSSFSKYGTAYREMMTNVPELILV